MVSKRFFEEMPICEKEILRYSGAKLADDNILNIMTSCLEEVRPKLSYKVCYDEFNISIIDDLCDFGVFSVKSKHLAKNLSGCKKAIIFGATVGSEIDRLIAKYGRLSPTKALMLQAIGAERIEALCDEFCDEIAVNKGRCLKPRFSPGYGDVPLDMQKDIFKVLDCAKQIGLCLNDSLLMSPSKSVTAIVGITSDEYEKTEKTNKCFSCNKKDCEFRSRV